jgi:VWFA-related protein
MVLGLLQFEGIKGRRAMIVFSDGLDLTSEYRPTDVAELARRVNVPIHAIAATPGVAAALSGGASSREAAENGELMRIAQATGGTLHALDSLGALPAIYSKIEAALRAQILVFVRTDAATRENDWRSVRVEVAAPDVNVFAPEGYYTSW